MKNCTKTFLHNAKLKKLLSKKKKSCSEINRFKSGITLVLFYIRYYRRGSNGCLENVPYVDNSYKYAGGGFLSNVEDLTKFGNLMLTSAQSDAGTWGCIL